MPSVTIRRTWKVDDVLTDVTTALLSDPTGTFGVKRNDTDAVVVADGVALTHVSTGVYEYIFTAAVGVAYTAYVEIVYAGATYHLEHDIPAVAADDSPPVTFDDVRDDYLLYADWESYRETDQATAIERARLFVTAATRLLILLPKASATRSRTSAEFDMLLIHEQIKQARSYLTIVGGAFAGDFTEHANLEYFRD